MSAWKEWSATALTMGNVWVNHRPWYYPGMIATGALHSSGGEPRYGSGGYSFCYLLDRRAVAPVTGASGSGRGAHRISRLTIMNRALTKPAEASRQSCGLCEAGHGQVPGKCYDRHGQCPGTYYGAVPALSLAVAMATLSRARVSSTLARPWACLQRPARRLFQSGMHTHSAISALIPGAR
jgi:hypothetical protein